MTYLLRNAGHKLDVTNTQATIFFGKYSVLDRMKIYLSCSMIHEEIKREIKIYLPKSFTMTLTTTLDKHCNTPAL